MADTADIRARLMQLIAEDFPEATAEQSFADMGMDSLDMVQLFYDVDDEFDVDIPQTSFRYFNCVKDIEEWIELQG